MKKYLPAIPVLAIMALVVVVSGCIGNDNVKVVGDNLEVSGITTDDNATYPSVSGMVKNTGSSQLSYVPVNVSFYDSNGNLADSGVYVVINVGPGEEKNFTVLSSYVGGSGSYKVIIGDPKTNVTAEAFAKSLEPFVNSYSGSKGLDTSSFDVIGTPIDAVNSYSTGYHTTGYPIDANATIFVEMNSGKEYVGQWVYQKTGSVVSGYKQYTDVAVVYWPEMKFVGWHRLYGPNPDAETTGYGGDIEGEAPDVSKWINSLPKKQ